MFVYIVDPVLKIQGMDSELQSFFIISGWDRHYAGLSDSDLATHSYEDRRSRPRHLLSPDKDYPGGLDSDLESVVSVTSSALSTQSERPRGSRGLR